MASRQIFRSSSGIVAGVCAGLADALNLDRTAVRAIAVILLLASSGSAGLFYLGLWFFIPRAPRSTDLVEVVPESVTSERYGSISLSSDGSDFAEGRFYEADACRVPRDMDDVFYEAKKENLPRGVRVGIAFGVVAMFAVVAAVGAPIFSGARWWQFWPLVLLVFGLVFVVLPLDGAPDKNRIHFSGVIMILAGGALTPTVLGIISWFTWINTMVALWPLLVLLFVFGYVGLTGGSLPALTASMVAFAMFVVAGFLVFYVPGNVLSVDFSTLGGPTIPLLSDERQWWFW